jgi:FAD/FMN-containing dehydrogenase
MRDLALDVRIARGDTEIDELWAIRHGASAALAAIADGRRSLQVVEDGCVPPLALADYLDAVDSASRSSGIDAIMFGHAGDGHVHVNLLPDPHEHGWLDRVREIYRAVNEALLRLGGTPAGEHGAGRLRAGSLEALLGPEAMACFAAIKRAFDPDGRFNPGVILPDGHDPFDRLKVGANAPLLPEGIEAELRRIEEQRRWGESRWD